MLNERLKHYKLYDNYNFNVMQYVQHYTMHFQLAW